MGCGGFLQQACLAQPVRSRCDGIMTTDAMKLPKELKTRIRNALMPLCPEKVIHTKPMHEAFVRLDSMFAREVMKRGEVLYEQTKHALNPSQ